MTNVQQKLLRAHVALALSQELGRRPTDAELHLHLRVLTRALAALGTARHHGQSEKPAQHGSQGGAPC